MKDDQKRKRRMIEESTALRTQHAEEGLRVSEELFRSHLEHAPDGVYLNDLKGTFLYGNRKSEEIIGYRREELIGKSFLDLNILTETSRIKADQLLRASNEGKSTGPDEIELIRKDGHLVPVEVTTTVIQQGGQEIVLSFVRDITDRKEAETALRESEERLRSKLSSILSPDHEVEEDELGNIIDTETIQSIMDDLYRLTQVGAAAILDLKGNVLVATGWQDICTRFHRVHPETSAKCTKSDLALSQGIPPGEIKGYKCENNLWDFVTPIFIGDKHLGNFYLGQFLFEDEVPDYDLFARQADRYGFDRDEYRAALDRVPRWSRERVDTIMRFYRQFVDMISGLSFTNLKLAHELNDRRRTELLLRQQTDAMDAAVDGMALLDEEGRYIYVNKAHVAVYGYDSAEELIGKTWRISCDSDSLEHFDREIMHEFHRKGYWSGEATGMKKDGSTFPQAISLTAMEKGGLICVVRDITERKQTQKVLEHTLESLRKAFEATIQAMVAAVESRDPYTAGHQLRVADLARAIATEMGLSQEIIEGIRMAGSIHDIGKLSIPADILSKPTRLSDIEFSIIKEHPRRGYEMLKDVESPWPIAQIVYQHHERIDGTGYPKGQKGDEILVEARIMAVADVVEAMGSHRPYRPALGLDAALEEIENKRGTLYDADAADACLRLFREKGYRLAEA